MLPFIYLKIVHRCSSEWTEMCLSTSDCYSLEFDLFPSETVCKQKNFKVYRFLCFALKLLQTKKMLLLTVI